MSLFPNYLANEILESKKFVIQNKYLINDGVKRDLLICFLSSFLFYSFSIPHEVGLKQTFRKETVLNLFRVRKTKQSKC